jgi:hypothetical protein
MVRMLDRPQLGRNIVLDLARWEVWSALDKVAAMFESAAAAENTLWIREMVVQYLLACPLPKAKEYIEQFEKMEPDLFKRKRRELESQIVQAEPAAAAKPAAVVDKPDDRATKSQPAQANTAADRDQPPNQSSPATITPLAWLLVPVALLAVVVVVLIVIASRRRGVGVSEQL